MSFWKDKPVAVSNETYLNNNTIVSKQILPIDKLFDITKSEIEKNKIQLDYDVIINPDDNIKQHLLNFINNNYMHKNTEFTLIYTKDLLNYFISNNTLCIVFYPKGTKSNLNTLNCISDKIIGIIIGKPQILNIRHIIKDENYTKLYNSIDVDFLCIKQQLRNLHVSSYMINVLTNKCITEYDKKICCATYTTNRLLNVKPFCTSTYYNRPLQIDNLLKCELLIDDNLNTKKIYNTFEYSSDFLLNKNLIYFNTLQNNFYDGINTIDSHQISNEIYDLLQKYNKSQYDIYAYKSKNDISYLLKNPAFHKFIIKDNTNTITDFICLYNLETKNLKSNYTCQNGYIYTLFLSKTDNLYKSNILELISEYCYQHKIFDMIIMLNIFDHTKDTNTDYLKHKLIKTYPNLYYYIYNIEIPTISPFRNGLITI